MSGFSLIQILAQEIFKTDPQGPMSWLTLAVQGGSFGLLAYFVIFVIPKAIDAIKTDRSELVKAFKEEVEVVRTRADLRTDKIALTVSTSVKALQDDIKENTVATRDLVLEMRDSTDTMKKANGK